METKNAVIFDVGIGVEDSGIVVVGIWLDQADGQQVFCRGVYAPKSGVDGKNYAGHFIYRVLEVVGVARWEQLKGKAVRVIGDSTHIEAIGNIIADKWFNPGKEFNLPDQDVPA